MIKCRKDRIHSFEVEHAIVQKLDFQGLLSKDKRMYRQYQKRNSFGITPQQKLYRIFQKKFYEQDRANGCLTLPRASAVVWKDELENPLSSIAITDNVTDGQIDLGSVVRPYYAMCFTTRKIPTQDDWDNFSHGREAVRITTSAQKLLDRIMDANDQYYMHRTWLIEVDYKNPCFIRRMRRSQEVYNRMESTGAFLALSAAIVQTKHSVEQEVRLLFDNGLVPPLQKVVAAKNSGLIRIPFEWNDFVESELQNP